MSISVIFPALFTDPWQPDLADFVLRTMVGKTKLDFELVIVETGSDALADREYVRNQRYIHRPKVTKLTTDLNDAIRESSGDYLVHIGIDVIVQDFWLEAMLEPFSLFKDCGASTIRVAEPGAIIGTMGNANSFDESMYGPLMMWAREKNAQEWLFDEAFEDHSADSDLIMRIYQAGMRSYRSNKAFAWHLNKVTWSRQENTKEREKKARELFESRYKDSPLMMAKMMMGGLLAYGRENDIKPAPFISFLRG